MKARERLFLTADRKRVVAEGDPDAAFLYAAPGDEIPESAVRMFGIEDGKASRDGKRRGGGEDKRRKDGEDKGGKGGGGSNPPADDLTRIKGIGPASAEALADAGIGSFDTLAAVDSENPPEIGITVKPNDWVSWAAQARIFVADRAKPAGGLTVEAPVETLSNGD